MQDDRRGAEDRELVAAEAAQPGRCQKPGGGGERGFGGDV